MKKRTGILIISTIILICVSIYLNNECESFLQDKDFLDIIIAWVNVLGVILVLHQLKDNRNLKEAEFLDNFNRYYEGHEQFMNIYNYCAHKKGIAFGAPIKELNYSDVVKYIDYFEPLYIAYRNGAIGIDNIAQLVEHRFLIVFRDEEVQKDVVGINKRYFQTATKLCNELYKHLYMRKEIPDWADMEYIKELIKDEVIRENKKYSKIIKEKARIKVTPKCNVKCRRAKPEESDLLTEMRVEFLIEAYGKLDISEMEIIEENVKQFMSDSLKDESFISWVAVDDDDKIIATSGISFYTLPPNQECNNGKVAYISNMYTNPDYREKGIGSKLFKHAVDEAKSRGCKKVLLDATKLGRPIYERYGFKDTKDDMVYYIKNIPQSAL